MTIPGPQSSASIWPMFDNPIFNLGVRFWDVVTDRLGLTMNWLQRQVWLRNLIMAAIMLGGCLYLGKYTSFNKTMVVQLIGLTAFLLPAFLLALAKGNGLLIYISLMWAVAPEIRRLADYYMGYYHAVSLISLLPLLTTGMLLLRILHKGIPENKPIRSMIAMFLIPFGYAAVIGIVINQAAGLYTVLTAVAPLCIFIYLISHPLKREEKDRFMAMYATLAVLLSIYGWIQYIYLPPWDLMWMYGAKMISLGKPAPMQFRVFSTMNSTGPLAIFLISALIPMVVNRKWRGPFGLLGILIVLSTLGTTLVRSAWVTLIVGILVYVLLAKSASRLKIILTLTAVSVAAMLALPLLPNSEQLTDRVGTLGNLEEDGSFNARIGLALHAVPEILKQPFGMGFGSIGQSSSKLGDGEGFAGLGSVDNGYLGTFATYGLIGGLLFFRAVLLYYRRIRTIPQEDNPYVPLALSTILQLMVAFFFGGGLEGLSAVIFWLFTGLAFMPPSQEAPAPQGEGKAQLTS